MQAVKPSEDKLYMVAWVHAVHVLSVRMSGRSERWMDAGYLHDLLLGALGANDVLFHSDESLPDERHLAVSALEAVVVPMTVLERDETRATDTWQG